MGRVIRVIREKQGAGRLGRQSVGEEGPGTLGALGETGAPRAPGRTGKAETVGNARRGLRSSSMRGPEGTARGN